MAQHDDDGLWVFGTRELARRPGTMRTLHRCVQAPDPLGTDVIAIPAGAPVDVALTLESVVEGVLATAQVSATAVGVCVRCLDEVTRGVDVRAQELFAYPDRAAHHAQHDAQGTSEEQPYELRDDTIDLETVVRDVVVTALPFQPTCRPDCPGLCAQCGARLAEDPEHAHDVVDPRWAALADLAGGNPTQRRT
ncbi:MAG TPA: YceD family protein [Ornithinimicrobium sp.]|uniref:YceD family protein n=1 Tax=Ornithinimicrobium sp. TaxID=1977084 RepID=UPI002B45EB0A|nr:YceD family protein [Ornithinimicrobium sp.]HKJ10901.1 YceD family protein [Ornithinimicrobium sp.]